ncbi:uncharacterized protein LOC133862533 [Alnus glutinosa]|uniref:uncharacterized protein LOC133862533 n=1 Tax=Alnus glutinosa TaxID=3517 RepID=UPI002D793CCC|nr:uncharacterized protein LOC133862533 [Alnus glutinosa]
MQEKMGTDDGNKRIRGMMMMILLIMVVVEQATSFHPQPPTLAPAQLPHFSGSQDSCIHVICAYKCEFKCLWRRPFSVEYMDCVADCMQDCLPRTTTDVNTFTPACPKFGFVPNAKETRRMKRVIPRHL